MNTELYVIRHGQTDFTKEKRYCGYRNLGINDFGKSQAANIKEKLKDIHFSKVYSSPLRRSLETQAIALPLVAPTIDDRLKELDFGVWEGLTHMEAMSKNPSLYTQWLHSPYSCTPPSGGDVKDLFRKAVEFLQYILKEHKGEKIAVFTHGGPIRAITGYLRKIEPENIWGILVNSASMSLFVLDNEKLIDYAANLGGEETP